MKKEVRVEGTAFTRRRQEWVHYEFANEEDMAPLFERMERMVEWSKDPWEAHRRRLELVAEVLEIEREGKPKGHQFKAREETGWYLDRLLMLGKCVQLHIDKGDPTWAAHEAALLGETWAELQLKLAREELFLLGKRTLEERSRGGGSNRKATDAQKLASYRKFLSAGHNITDATYLAAGELGVSESNIRAARKAAGTSD